MAADDSDSDEAPQRPEEEPAERQVVDEEGLLNDPKLGAKKKAKIEAKLEKKAQREVRIHRPTMTIEVNDYKSVNRCLTLNNQSFQVEEKLRKEKKEQEAKQDEERKK